MYVYAITEIFHGDFSLKKYLFFTIENPYQKCLSKTYLLEPILQHVCDKYNRKICLLWVVATISCVLQSWQTDEYMLKHDSCYDIWVPDIDTF